jgi:hypothetical protein
MGSREYEPVSERGDGAGVPGGRANVVLLLTVGAAVAVRLAWLLLEPRCELAGDEPSWIALGTKVVGRPGRFSPLRNTLVFYPPVYPYFLAVLHRLLRSHAAMLAVQALVGALVVPAVWSAGRRAYGPRAGALSALVAAFYPELVWFSVHFWSETVFLVLLWWAMERLIRADASERLGLAAAAGVLWGLAALTRDVALLLAPVALVWSLRRGRRAWRIAALFALGVLLTIAPWTIRNAVVFHSLIPISTMGAENVWVGNAKGLSPSDVSKALQEAGGPVEQDRLAISRALEAIGERQPFWLVEKLRTEMPAFWAAGSEILDQLEGRLSCGPLSRRATITARVVTVGPYLLVLPCFVVGLCLVRPTAPAALMLGVLAADNLVHVAAFATPRFRLPVLPVVFVVGAAAVVRWREGRLAPLEGRRLLGLLLVSAAALAIVGPSLIDLVR